MEVKQPVVDMPENSSMQADAVREVPCIVTSGEVGRREPEGRVQDLQAHEEQI